MIRVPARPINATNRGVCRSLHETLAIGENPFRGGSTIFSLGRLILEEFEQERKEVAEL
jgi:hypothetical protein